MPRTIRITTYLFDELTEEAKKRAIAFYDANTNPKKLTHPEIRDRLSKVFYRFTKTGDIFRPEMF